MTPCSVNSQQILQLNPEMGAAFILKGGIALLRRQYDEAVRHCEKAVSLAPSDSHNLGFLGIVYRFAGESEKAVTSLKTAMRLSPHCPTWQIYHFATATLWTGNFGAALDAGETYLRKEPDDPYAYMNLATIYGFQGLDGEASAIVSQLRDKFPEFGVKNIVTAEPYREREKLDRVIEVLRRAGLPG